MKVEKTEREACTAVKEIKRLRFYSVAPVQSPFETQSLHEGNNYFQCHSQCLSDHKLLVLSY